MPSWRRGRSLVWLRRRPFFFFRCKPTCERNWPGTVDHTIGYSGRFNSSFSCSGAICWPFRGGANENTRSKRAKAERAIQPHQSATWLCTDQVVISIAPSFKLERTNQNSFELCVEKRHDCLRSQTKHLTVSLPSVQCFSQCPVSQCVCVSGLIESYDQHHVELHSIWLPVQRSVTGKNNRQSP